MISIEFEKSWEDFSLPKKGIIKGHPLEMNTVTNPHQKVTPLQIAQCQLTLNLPIILMIFVRLKTAILHGHAETFLLISDLLNGQRLDENCVGTLDLKQAITSRSDPSRI